MGKNDSRALRTLAAETPWDFHWDNLAIAAFLRGATQGTVVTKPFFEAFQKAEGKVKNMLRAEKSAKTMTASAPCRNSVGGATGFPNRFGGAIGFPNRVGGATGFPSIDLDKLASIDLNNHL